MQIGILALQGAVAPHRQSLSALGAQVVMVRTAAELSACAGLILPGGESSTMLNLIHHYRLWEPLREFAQSHGVWGVCAGSILMAAAVENPAQECFGLMPVTVKRNAYGRQNESFIATLPVTLPGGSGYDQECVFIRAPMVTAWGPEITLLIEYEGHPVALAHGRHLMTTFHPELSTHAGLHRFFLSLCSGETVGQSA